MEKGLISVDRWSEESQAYFLTHLHSDHTRGLSAAWRRGPLFCSSVSARLLPSRFPGLDLSLVRILKVGVTRALDLAFPTTGFPARVLVTPIDANHCPGAVMYLFRGTFGWVLNTGDFRWELSSERAQLAKKMLLDILHGDTIDVLYIDNTYCHPSLSFPPRDAAAQQVVDIITKHPDHQVIIGIDKLGKEDLLVHISKALNTKIWVWPERLQTMHLLGYENIFTANTSLTRVQAVPRYSLTFKTLDTLNSTQPTIGIIASGLPWMLDLFGKYKESGNQLHKDQMQHGRKLKENVYCVPYSEHSCFSEIKEFIRILQPSVVSGIVSSTSCHVNPSTYFAHRPSNGACGGFKGQNVESVDANERGPLHGCKSSIRAKARYHPAKLSIRRSRASEVRRTIRGGGAKIIGVDEDGSQ